MVVLGRTTPEAVFFSDSPFLQGYSVQSLPYGVLPQTSKRSPTDVSEA